MKEYITDTEFIALMEDLQNKIKNEDFGKCKSMINRMIEDTKKKERYIDRTYIGVVKERKRTNRISQINDMLKRMSSEQVANVHRYTVNEYDEPNHEAEALKAIVNLSHK